MTRNVLKSTWSIRAPGGVLSDTCKGSILLDTSLDVMPLSRFMRRVIRSSSLAVVMRGLPDAFLLATAPLSVTSLIVLLSY